MSVVTHWILLQFYCLEVKVHLLISLKLMFRRKNFLSILFSSFLFKFLNAPINFSSSFANMHSQFVFCGQWFALEVGENAECLCSY